MLIISIDFATCVHISIQSRSPTLLMDWLSSAKLLQVTSSTLLRNAAVIGPTYPQAPIRCQRVRLQLSQREIPPRAFILHFLENTAPALAEDVTRRRRRSLTQLQVSKEDEDAPLTSYKLARRRAGSHSPQNSLAHGCAQDVALVEQICYFDSLDGWVAESIKASISITKLGPKRRRRRRRRRTVTS